MQSFVAAIRFFDDRTANRCAALQHIDDVLAFPAASTDDHELGGGVAGRRKGAGDGRRNGASRTGGKTRIRTVSRLRFFAVFGNCILRGIWHRFRGAVTVALEDEPVGAVA